MLEEIEIDEIEEEEEDFSHLTVKITSMHTMTGQYSIKEIEEIIKSAEELDVDYLQDFQKDWKKNLANPKTRKKVTQGLAYLLQMILISHRDCGNDWDQNPFYDQEEDVYDGGYFVIKNIDVVE